MKYCYIVKWEDLINDLGKIGKREWGWAMS